MPSGFTLVQLCYRGTTECHFRKGRLSTLSLPKTAVLALAVSSLAAGLAGCGGPKTTIENSGTYTVGADIVAGTYAARDPRKYNDNPLDCAWTLRKGGVVIATENGGMDRQGGGPARVVVLSNGAEFTTTHCGPWTSTS